MTTRRESVRLLAALAAVGLTPRAMRAGLLRFGTHDLLNARDTIEPIGIQLYTVRRLMQQDMPRTLAALASIGYREVEFAGYFGRSPSDVRAMLATNGLSAPSTHLGLGDVQERFTTTADIAHTIGMRYLTVASLDMRTLTRADDWKRMADTFNAIGRQCAAAGLRFGYHNHSAEFAMVEGQAPLDLLITGTDPALVTFELDLYWTITAGQDPIAYFKKHPGRFEMVHVKDATAAPAQAMTDVGAGVVHWASIFAQHDTAGIRHYFVEHDNPAEPLESARRSATYLRALHF